MKKKSITPIKDAEVYAKDHTIEYSSHDAFGYYDHAEEEPANQHPEYTEGYATKHSDNASSDPRPLSTYSPIIPKCLFHTAKDAENHTAEHTEHHPPERTNDQGD